ncbi:lysyl-tRNA synthetase [Ophiocordyceps sinensis CO18]|uniref:Lysyl-tRNA synthetase n=1 Tax=Ophiocordyceps sinensis (strain Co18 / CGMCC 3.14243) TaxID=911162 RepID=T5AH69_OPHSC|nr:lysyl-tRNA synthetase [Ophiocordyceps sinensis CO18]
MPARALATAASGGPRKKSRFAVEEGGEHEQVSNFKQQRQRELQEDRESEDPFCPDPYPRLTSDGRKSVVQFLEDFDSGPSNKEVVIMGRVRSKRVAGSALIFLDIVNEFQKVQIMINKKKCVPARLARNRKFTVLKHLIQVGDHISVIGVATRTEAGEPTLEARELPELLAPSMEQIPDKLTNPKSRIKERHVDMLVNREVVDVLRLRSEITKYMRDHLHSKRFLEFQTPILAGNAGGAVARPFVTRSSANLRNRALALRVAPELWLKRLVVGGVDRVFEIGPAFRNEGVDATHNPEFTMCEFYSAYTNLADLIAETEELLHGLARRCQELIATQLTSLPPVDLSRFVRPFRQVELVPALEACMGLRLPKLSGEDALPEMLAMLRLGGIEVPGEVPSTLPKLLDRLTAQFLETMSFKEPIFITNHPACMSPLAKSFVCPNTLQLVSARAELFVGGRELANMYEEENNPEEQRRKLLAHRRLAAVQNVDEKADDKADDKAAAQKAEKAAVQKADGKVAVQNADEKADDQADEKAAVQKADEKAAVQNVDEKADDKADDKAAAQKAEKAAVQKADGKVAVQNADEKADDQADEKAAVQKADEKAAVQNVDEKADDKADDKAAAQKAEKAAVQKADGKVAVQNADEKADDQADEKAAVQKADEKAAVQNVDEKADDKADDKAAAQKAEKAAVQKADGKVAVQNADEKADDQADEKAAVQKADEKAAVQNVDEKADDKADDKAAVQNADEKAAAAYKQTTAS